MSGYPLETSREIQELGSSEEDTMAMVGSELLHLCL